MVSLQWGRQQTYYPNAQPYTTTELAAVNCKLAKAVSSHLLGNVGTNSPKKTSAAVEFCNTPAEKMAEMVRTLQSSQSVSTVFFLERNALLCVNCFVSCLLKKNLCRGNMLNTAVCFTHLKKE